MSKKWEVALFVGGESIAIIVRDDNLQEAIGRVLWEAFDKDLYPERKPLPQNLEISYNLGNGRTDIISTWDGTTDGWDGDFAIIWIQHRENEPIGYIRRIGK